MVGGVTLLKFTSASAVQPLNACVSISVTELGMVRVVSAVSLANMLLLIFVSLAGKVMLFRLGLLPRAAVPKATSSASKTISARFYARVM